MVINEFTLGLKIKTEAAKLGAAGRVIFLMEWKRDNFTVSCDTERLSLSVITSFLAESYWAKGVPSDVVEKSIRHSLNFGLFDRDQQIGYARVVSDHSTFAFLGDVFLLPEYRGSGLGKWLIQCVVKHPELQNLRRWLLATKDAHALYRQFGFTDLNNPNVLMEIHDPDIYGA
jgi:ribosomal protein S18 acetylase RimI-like enzyme